MGTVGTSVVVPESDVLPKLPLLELLLNDDAVLLVPGRKPDVPLDPKPDVALGPKPVVEVDPKPVVEVDPKLDVEELDPNPELCVPNPLAPFCPVCPFVAPVCGGGVTFESIS